MKKRWLMIVLVLCLTMSLLACGKKTDDESEALQTQAQMTWQEQYDLGIRLLNEGKYEDAILAFQAAIQIDPKKADAYVILADAYVQAGNRDGAMAALQDGLDHADNVDWVKDVASGLGFYIDENGRVYTMSEDESIAASEAAVQECLAALESKDRISYYISQQEREKSYGWLFDNNITLFGQDVMDLSLNDIVSIGNDQGWNVGRLRVERYDGVPYTYVMDSEFPGYVYAQLYDEGAAIGLGMTWLEMGYQSNDYARRNEFLKALPAGASIGMLDLCYGDSLSTALSKMGFVFAEEIATAAMEWPEEEGNTNQKYVRLGTKYVQDPSEGEKNGEWVELSYEISSTAVNGYWQDWIQIEIYVTRNMSGEGCQSTKLQLYFYGPEYQLWGYHIMNTY